MHSVLQINICTTGSTGRIAEQINQTAATLGWDTYFAYGRSVSECKSSLIKIGNKFSVYEAAVEARLFDNDGLASKLATKRLVKNIQELNPDIIHLHNLHGYYVNYKILFEYLNSTNIPIVWTLHDCWSFTGHCAHFVSANCERWKTGCHHCPLTRNYPSCKWLDRSVRNYHLKKNLFTANNNLHIVCVSQWLGNLAKQSFLGCKDIRVINNGIDIDIFAPSHVQRKSSRFEILGVSNVWNRGKGLFDFYQLRDLLDIGKYNITLVGLTDEQRRNLPDGIMGITRTSSTTDLAKLYAQADVFVNPTYADSFPTVNIEALACGTPVITYNTGGSPEIIDGSTGLVVKQGDVMGLCKAIEQLESSNLNDRLKRRKQCCHRAMRLYNKNDRYLDYLSLYDSLI